MAELRAGHFFDDTVRILPRLHLPPVILPVTPTGPLKWHIVVYFRVGAFLVNYAIFVRFFNLTRLFSGCERGPLVQTVGMQQLWHLGPGTVLDPHQKIDKGGGRT